MNYSKTMAVYHAINCHITEESAATTITPSILTISRDSMLAFIH